MHSKASRIGARFGREYARSAADNDPPGRASARPPCRPDGRELHQLPRKADALPALLALQPGRPIAREMIADFLWTDRGPEQARHSLRQTLLVLRRSVATT